MVSSSGTFVEANFAGRNIQGAYGNLTLYSDGHYEYEPSSTLTYADREATDRFTYKLVLPNGHETIAELAIQLTDGSNVSGQVETADFQPYSNFFTLPPGDTFSLANMPESDDTVRSAEPNQSELPDTLFFGAGGGEIPFPSSIDDIGGSNLREAITPNSGDMVSEPIVHMMPDPMPRAEELLATYIV